MLSSDYDSPVASICCEVPAILGVILPDRRPFIAHIHPTSWNSFEAPLSDEEGDRSMKRKDFLPLIFGPLYDDAAEVRGTVDRTVQLSYNMHC